MKRIFLLLATIATFSAKAQVQTNSPQRVMVFQDKGSFVEVTLPSDKMKSGDVYEISLVNISKTEKVEYIEYDKVGENLVETSRWTVENETSARFFYRKRDYSVLKINFVTTTN